MSDIAAFIRARLDKDEQVARTATPGPWRWTNAGSDTLGEQPVLESESDPTTVVIDATGNHTEGYVCIDAGDQAHIARWDPARALAEVQAKRRIAETHQRIPHRCPMPVIAGENGQLWTDEEGPCYTLRLLALPYDWHDDYKEEWRP
jgi:hypothetical protein